MGGASMRPSVENFRHTPVSSREQLYATRERPYQRENQGNYNATRCNPPRRSHSHGSPAGTPIQFAASREQQQQRHMIEIVPGVEKLLRGAEETSNAIDSDFIATYKCFSCESTVVCIRDAEYVICPECRVVGPNEQGHRIERFGVGLGVLLSDVAQMQER